MKVTLGAFIAGLRKEKGLTQRELSEMLSVSDKTVSHWERDETSPDISLLPVIADIFGITVDELLKGEKKEAENGSSHKNAENKNKGILYALDISFNKFRTKNYISIALSVIAVLFGSIASYFKTVDVGYLVFIALLIVPILLTALFRGNFTSALVSPYADEEALKSYGKKANRITLCNLYFSFLCFVLYSARVILYYADIPLVLIIFLASGALVILCERTLRKRDLVSTSDKPLIIKKKTLLKIFSCLLCAVMLFAIYLSCISVSETDIMYEKAEYTTVSAEDFVALMEKDTPAPDQIYSVRDGRFEDTELLPSDKGTEYSFYPEFGDDSTAIEVLNPDYDGEINFTYNNLEIARYSQYEDRFRVYTHSQLIKAREEAEREEGILFVIHLLLSPAAPALSAAFYFVICKFFLKKSGKDTLSLNLF